MSLPYHGSQPIAVDLLCWEITGIESVPQFGVHIFPMCFLHDLLYQIHYFRIALFCVRTDEEACRQISVQHAYKLHIRMYRVRQKELPNYYGEYYEYRGVLSAHTLYNLNTVLSSYITVYLYFWDTVSIFMNIYCIKPSFWQVYFSVQLKFFLKAFHWSVAYLYGYKLQIHYGPTSVFDWKILG
jgi:hypothetical protein